ncbi:MAG TPA: hypothetical protein VNG51_12685 [Ktedonobacteraceae bacterium]|nr:hypothetical protein [Ktedonobacteraceae bacterium]
MDRIDYKEELEILSKEGFTQEEIGRLTCLRQMYHMQEQEADLPQMNLLHLQFIRWLVEHGKLSEELS